MQIKLELIAAACENMGIGINGTLPWHLKSEMEYFNRMTKMTKDIKKKNIVIMGRKTWESIPLKHKPLKQRINVVLSKTLVNENILIYKDLNTAIIELSKLPLINEIERVWVIGGYAVYKAAMDSEYFHRLYLTKIMKEFKCDTFFPTIPADKCKLIEDPDVPTKIMEENGIKYQFQVFERVQ